MVSGTMNRTMDEVSRLASALGDRHAGTFDAMPSHTPCDAALEAAKEARAADADLVVTFGGGSLTTQARWCGSRSSIALRISTASTRFARVWMPSQ
jgi:maleylacetate reductase